MKRISSSLYEKQIKQLHKISTERIKFSEHIRRAIDAYLARYEYKASE